MLRRMNPSRLLCERHDDLRETMLLFRTPSLPDSLSSPSHPERMACGDVTHVARFYVKEKSGTMVWPMERLLGIL